MSDIISDPNDWTFGRCEMPSLFTCANKRDYLFAGACAFSLTVSGTNTTQTTQSQGWAIDLVNNDAIENNSGTVTVNTLEVHRFQVGDIVYMNGVVMTSGATSAYNSTLTDDGSVSQWNGGWEILSIPTPTSFTFAATSGMTNGDAGGAGGITNFGYATSASMQEVNNNFSPPNVWPLTVKRELAVSSRVYTPERVCALTDYGTGVLKIRMLFVPGAVIYAVTIVYQAKAPLKVAMTDTWSPIPDQFSAIYRQACVYRCYRYLNSPNAAAEYEKLQQEIKKSQATDDATLTDVSLIPESSLMDSDLSGWGW